MTAAEIIAKLPYDTPFIFVEELTHISETGITGNYTFKEEAFFYQGHFKGNPVTPGVILNETMAQIGVVCLGIYLVSQNNPVTKSYQELPNIALTSSQIDFYIPVYPNQKVTVISEKIYFRFRKLKCQVKLFNENEELVCKGEISGMFGGE